MTKHVHDPKQFRYGIFSKSMVSRKYHGRKEITKKDLNVIKNEIKYNSKLEKENENKPI